MIEIIPEANVAAKWWTDQLRNGATMQSGSEFQRQICPRSAMETDLIDVMSMLAASAVDKLTDEQLTHFQDVLAMIVQKLFIDGDDWTKAKTHSGWGSANRVLAVDYGPCDELRCAYQDAGGQIAVTIFPIKTTMWINPSSVTVRCGYDGDVVELMGGHDDCIAASLEANALKED